MITSKERKFLSSLGQKIEPVFQIGKNGITPVMIHELSAVLDARELIKITVLKNCDLSAKETANILSEELTAETVSVIGSKIVLYRENPKDKKIFLQ